MTIGRDDVGNEPGGAEPSHGLPGRDRRTGRVDVDTPVSGAETGGSKVSHDDPSNVIMALDAPTAVPALAAEVTAEPAPLGALAPLGARLLLSTPTHAAAAVLGHGQAHAKAQSYVEQMPRKQCRRGVEPSGFGRDVQPRGSHFSARGCKPYLVVASVGRGGLIRGPEDPRFVGVSDDAMHPGVQIAFKI